jgi:hypothetical protein
MGNIRKETENDKGKKETRHKLAGQKELMNLNWNKSGESIERGTILSVKTEIGRGKYEEGKNDKTIKPNICEWAQVLKPKVDGRLMRSEW